MSDELKTESKKKPTPKGQKEAPVHVIREGAIAASIWRRTTGHGLDYFEYTLSRSWKSKTDKTGYSQSFFARNQDALAAVIKKASAYIAELDANVAEKLAA